MKIFTSFQEFAAYCGIHPSVPRSARRQNCRLCGSVMREIPGTNVMVCDGEMKNQETGKVVKCTNVVLRSRVNPA